MAEKIIDFDNYKTIPSNIKKYIRTNKKDFIVSTGKNPTDRYHIIFNKNADKHKKWFCEALTDWKIYAAHFTRVSSLTDFDNGIEVLNFNQQLVRIKNILMENGFSNVLEMDILEKHFQNTCPSEQKFREGKLYFYYPVSKGRLCQHYCDVIGGEVFTLLCSKTPQIQEMLSSIGVPVKVHAQVPFNQIDNYHKEHLVNRLIQVVLARRNIKFITYEWTDKPIAIDSKLEPENILRLEVVIKE